MNNEELNQLAAAAKAGDEQAFGQIFDALSDDIYRVLAFRVRDTATAHDLAGEVWLDSWRSLPRFDTERSFKAWIFAIARYKLIDHYRRYRSTTSLDAVTEMADATDIPAEIAIKTEFAQVAAVLHQLPELYQTVLQLKFIDELEYREIAEITGKTENHLRVIVKRGLDRLRGVMSNE